MVWLGPRVGSAMRGAGWLLPLGFAFAALLGYSVGSAFAHDNGDGKNEESFGLASTLSVPAPANNTACPSTGATSTGLASFDISFVDSELGLYFLADRTHCSVDIWNTETNALVAQVNGFAGITGTNFDEAGPNGVLTVVTPTVKQAWVGNYPSEVEIIDLTTNAVIKTISTGGTKRADEMAYDPKDGIVVVANDADSPPFLSFISTTAPYPILGTITFSTATNGLEQSAWSPRTGLFYLSVPELGGVLDSGVIAVIDPTTRTIIKSYPTGCEPAGLALGPEKFAYVGCSDKSTEQINLASGHIMKVFPQFNSTDEVWFNPEDGHYFGAAGNNVVNNVSTPVLGIIDGQTRKFDQVISTVKGDHSVAADSDNGHVYLPSVAKPANDSSCTLGCVEVLAADHKEHGKE